MKEKCLSLSVRDKVFSDLKEITGNEFSLSFNDLYSRKDGTCRRLKGGLGRSVHKGEWMIWKQIIESKDYGMKVEFDCLDYYKSDSKKRYIEYGLNLINNGNCSWDEYFNMDQTFIIRIIF